MQIEGHVVLIMKAVNLYSFRLERGKGRGSESGCMDAKRIDLFLIQVEMDLLVLTLASSAIDQLVLLEIGCNAVLFRNFRRVLYLLVEIQKALIRALHYWNDEEES